MYAMLTGTLPFTVEPFSLRALYQKMVDKEMNPLPAQLSTGNAPAAPGSRAALRPPEALCLLQLWGLDDPVTALSLPSMKTKSPEMVGFPISKDTLPFICSESFPCPL